MKASVGHDGPESCRAKQVEDVWAFDKLEITVLLSRLILMKFWENRKAHGKKTCLRRITSTRPGFGYRVTGAPRKKVSSSSQGLRLTHVASPTLNLLVWRYLPHPPMSPANLRMKVSEWWGFEVSCALPIAGRQEIAYLVR